jgi:hypothetical protein
LQSGGHLYGAATDAGLVKNGQRRNLQGERLRSPSGWQGLLPKTLSAVESGRDA